MEYSAPETTALTESKLSGDFRSKFLQVFGPALIGLVGGTLTLAYAFVTFTSVLKSCATTYAKFPSQSPSWLFFDITLPGWLQWPLILTGLLAPFGMGLATAWLVRGRDRWGQLSAGLTTALTASFTAYFLWIGCLVSVASVIVPSIADLTLLADSTKQPITSGTPSDVLAERYPDLKNTPTDERGGVFFAKIVSDQVSGSAHSVWLGVGLSLASVGGVGLFGTLTASWLYRRGGSFKSIFVPYLELSLSTSISVGISMATLFGMARDRADSPSKLFLCLGLIGCTVLINRGVVGGWNRMLRVSTAVTYVLLLASLIQGVSILAPMLGLALVGFQLMRRWLVQNPPLELATA